MIASARNKKQPLFTDYLSHSQLTSMYNSLARMPYKDPRIVYTNLHLILEITLKKIAIYHGFKVSVTSHRIGDSLLKLKEVEPFVKDMWSFLQGHGLLRYLQRFPYDSLRFNSKESIPPIPMDVFFVITRNSLRRLEYIEKESLTL